ncbi:PspC domain-containing protein [Lactiplantibacillus garii]|uniref:PspC domain-containing protein n=1 Tax=Lactiplantibacillus garii TaxID=2306423 RepID=A0A426DAX6_9LACO|nr:PspC domain-containing protein [Lactiplantibacillus garii]RRK11788.1 PspC domain-containing protein [Lactiplantibacillus garii]
MKSNTNRKLTKSNNRVVAGVLGGIAEYLNWNANVLRVLFVLLTLASHGFGILLYLVLMTIMPSRPENGGFFEQMRRTSQGNGTARPQPQGRKEIHNVHEEDEPRHHD